MSGKGGTDESMVPNDVDASYALFSCSFSEPDGFLFHRDGSGFRLSLFGFPLLGMESRPQRD